MEEYPYTEVVDGKEYTYIDMGTYYVTSLETGDRRLVQRERYHSYSVRITMQEHQVPKIQSAWLNLERFLIHLKQKRL